MAKNNPGGFCGNVHAFSWIISNYEYCEDVFVQTKLILDAALKDKQELNALTLGMFIQAIWGEKVELERIYSIDVEKDGPGYRHLRKREIDYTRGTRITEINEETLKDIQLLCAAHPGWSIDPSVEDKQSITLLKFPNSESGESIIVDEHRVVFAITIRMFPTQTMTLSTYGQPAVSFKDIKGLDETEISLDAIDDAIRLVQFASPCVGLQISDDAFKFLKLSVSGSKVLSVTSDNLGKHQTLISDSCLLVTLRGKLCRGCSYTAKLFRNRESKRKANSNLDGCIPHKKCNVRYLDRTGLEERIATQRKEIRNDSKRDCRLKEVEMIEFAEDDSTDLLKILQTINVSKIPPDMKLLWDLQMKSLSAKNHNGYRWDPRIVRFALDVYCKNPKALDAMREFLVLPSNRLIRYYKNSVNQEPGWNDETILWCKNEAQRHNLKPEEYWGGLILDEMKIQEDLQMTIKGGRHQLTGIVSLGDFYNDLKKIETECESAIPIATHLLQFVFLSDGGFRFPLAHFPTAQCPPSVLYLQFWEGVLQMKRAGFSIYFVVCDGGDSNRQFIKMHFGNCNPVDLHFIGYNMMTEDPMMFIMDCKHNFKKLRNNAEKSATYGTTRCLTTNGRNILWSHWREAYSWDQKNNSCHFHEKLKEEHFQLTPSSRMRNSLAEDVLDKKMFLLVKAYKDHLATVAGDCPNRLDETITFLKHTSLMVELFSDKHGIYHVKDNRLLKLQASLRYFTNWRLNISAPKEFLSNKLWFDLQSMILGFISLVKIKLARFPGSMIKPAIINQDVVENHFSQLRGANGQNDHPTYQTVQGTQNSIIFGQTTISKKCNTGTVKNHSFANLPKENLFGKNGKQQAKDKLTIGLLSYR